MSHSCANKLDVLRGRTPGGPSKRVKHTGNVKRKNKLACGLLRLESRHLQIDRMGFHAVHRLSFWRHIGQEGERVRAGMMSFVQTSTDTCFCSFLARQAHAHLPQHLKAVSNPRRQWRSHTAKHAMQRPVTLDTLNSLLDPVPQP